MASLRSYSDRVSQLVLANTLHNPEIWQRNHDDVNRELRNEFPEVSADIQRLRASGLPTHMHSLHPKVTLSSAM